MTRDPETTEDRKSLEAWLNSLPQQTPEERAKAHRVAVTLAMRSAARVLSVFWGWTLESAAARKFDLTSLPPPPLAVFRGMMPARFWSTAPVCHA